MKDKFYFAHRDAEFCYKEDYFLDEMKDAGISEMEVLEAVRDYGNPECFFCKAYGEITMKDDNICGKGCADYEPRNKVSGRCRHHSTALYCHGNPVTIQLSVTKKSKQ